MGQKLADSHTIISPVNGFLVGYISEVSAGLSPTAYFENALS
jgi:hypothetical protein